MAPPPEETQSRGGSGKSPKKPQPSAFKHPMKNKTEATTQKDLVDTRNETFSANSSINNFNLPFLIIRTNADKQKLNFESINSEKYYQPFTAEELKEATQRSHNTTVGSSEIRYEFLKQLPKLSPDYLLTIFNDILINGK